MIASRELSPRRHMTFGLVDLSDSGYLIYFFLISYAIRSSFREADFKEVLMSLVSWLILAGAIIVVLALVFLIIAKQYRKVGPNEALIISGRKRTSRPATGRRKRSATATAWAAGRSSCPSWKPWTSCPWTSSRSPSRPRGPDPRRRSHPGRRHGPGQGRFLGRRHPHRRRAVPRASARTASATWR